MSSIFQRCPALWLKETSPHDTHTEHQPRVPSLCSCFMCPHDSHFAFCSYLKSLLLPKKSLFLPQLVSHLLDFFFSSSFDCTLQQPEFYANIKPGSFFFLLFLFFLICTFYQTDTTHINFKNIAFIRCLLHLSFH